jgi:hypothetical protein
MRGFCSVAADVIRPQGVDRDEQHAVRRLASLAGAPAGEECRKRPDDEQIDAGAAPA